MGDREVTASAFRQRCLSLLDQVERTKVRIVITKRGRPVARLVPVDDAEIRAPTLGTVRLLADDDAYFSTDESWSADG
jgi:prevent-host-death family protein